MARRPKIGETAAETGELLPAAPAEPAAAAPYKPFTPTGYDPDVADDDPHAAVKLLRYINNKAANIQRAAYRFEKMMDEGRILTQDDAMQVAKSLYLIATGEELDDILIKRGARPLSQAEVDKAFPGGQPRPTAPAASAPGPFDDDEEEGAPKCPKCGRVMKRRTRKVDGQPFWGCPGYFVKGDDGKPVCREIVPITATVAAAREPTPFDGNGEENPADVPGETNLF